MRIRYGHDRPKIYDVLSSFIVTDKDTGTERTYYWIAKGFGGYMNREPGTILVASTNCYMELIED